MRWDSYPHLKLLNTRIMSRPSVSYLLLFCMLFCCKKAEKFNNAPIVKFELLTQEDLRYVLGYWNVMDKNSSTDGIYYLQVNNLSPNPIFVKTYLEENNRFLMVKTYEIERRINNFVLDGGNNPFYPPLSMDTLFSFSKKKFTHSFGPTRT